MDKYGLIGHPLGHSMSPLIHKKLFALSGIEDFSYELIDIAPENLANSEDMLRGLKGFNITIPHKTEIIPMTDRLGESAERYSSVNCISNDSGVMTGYNTDCDGFLRSAEIGQPIFSPKPLLRRQVFPPPSSAQKNRLLRFLSRESI